MAQAYVERVFALFFPDCAFWVSRIFYNYRNLLTQIIFYTEQVVDIVKQWRLLLYVMVMVVMSSAFSLPALAASQHDVNQQEAALDHLEASISEAILAPNNSAEFQVYAVYDNKDRIEITNDTETKYETTSSLFAVDPGKITAGSKTGKGKLKITYQTKSLELSVTISKTAIVSLEASPTTVFVNVNKKSKVTLKAKQADNKLKDITKLASWSIDDKAIAEVKKGEVTGKKEGSALITATYKGKSTTIKVQVIPNKKIKELVADKTELSLHLSEKAQVTITAQYEDKTSEDVTAKVAWKIKDTTIVEEKDGALVAKKAGKTTVTAIYGDKKLEIPVTVTDVQLLDVDSITGKEIPFLGGSLYYVTGKAVSGAKLSIEILGTTYPVNKVEADGSFKYNSGILKSGITEFTLKAEKDGAEQVYTGKFETK